MRALIILAILAFPATARGATWLGAVDPYSQRSNPTAAAFLQLFAPNAPWNAAAAHIQVFKTSTQFLGNAMEAELSTLIAGLDSRHIVLGMAGLLLVESARCGRGVESYGGAGAIQAVAERVKRLGGSIHYVAMDEPLWYGNHVVGPRNCHDSVESLAQQMAPNVRALKAAFPEIQFGDTEPLNDQTFGRIDDMLHFAQAFRAATNEPLSFVHADIMWRQNWRPQLVEWKTKLHAAGIQLGVIINGDFKDQTDGEWVGHAIGRYREVTSDLATQPDDAIFQSWNTNPTRLLPDTEPDTLTGLVKRATPQ